MGSTSLHAAAAHELSDHWSCWRPEWTADRTCLYWYLTFTEAQVDSVVGEHARRGLDGTEWLDVVPSGWSHVTLCDVAFDEDLEPSDVDAVTAAVAEAMTGQERLRLDLGPVEAHASAVVLATGPLSRLRPARRRVRRATSSVLGARHTDVHRRVYWPHLSLGYVNRSVDAATVDHFLAAVPPLSAQVEVDALTLAAVTRRDRSYRWEVRGKVDLV